MRSERSSTQTSMGVLPTRTIGELALGYSTVDPWSWMRSRIRRMLPAAANSAAPNFGHRPDASNARALRSTSTLETSIPWALVLVEALLTWCNPQEIELPNLQSRRPTGAAVLSCCAALSRPRKSGRHRLASSQPQLGQP